MKRKHRNRVWKNHKAVSDIVANILIAGLVVTAFSGIVYWVSTLPAPTGEIYVDLSGNLEPIKDEITGEWIGGYINITHGGGNTLDDWSTRIYVSIDDITNITTISDSTPPIGDDWSTGEVWHHIHDSIREDSKIFITIVDTSKNVVVWSCELPPEKEQYPIITLSGTVPSPITRGNNFIVYAKITDPDNDLTSVQVNLSNLNSTEFPIPISMTYKASTNRYETSSSSSTNVSTGTYSCPLTATDSKWHNTTKNVYIVVQYVTSELPDLVVKSEDITFSKENPLHGEIISITSVIYNIGGSATGANVTFLDGNDWTQIDKKHVTTIASGGGATVTTSWETTAGGTHRIWVNATVDPPLVDADTTGEGHQNQNYKEIAVMPTILLVDDDQKADGATLDSVSYMKSALSATDFSYDLTIVGSGDGPSGDTLDDYDVVIWITGNETTKTLTSKDQTNLQTYLDKRRSLWLIGQDVLNNLGVNTFMTNYLKVSTVSTWNAGLPDPLRTVPSNPIWNGTDTNYTISTRSGWADKAERITIGTGAKSVVNNTANNQIYGVSYEHTTKGYRSVFFPWEFSLLKNTDDQAQVAYYVLMWLGNLSHKLGRDVSVSQEEFSTTTPKFMDPVYINVTVRNNGEGPAPAPSNETYVDVSFTDIYNGVRFPMEGSPITISSIEPYGGKAWANITWTPNKVGYHTIEVKVDPNNVIPETNEYNNEISYLLSTGQIFVSYRILLVDDDHNATDDPNPGALIADSLNGLNPPGESERYIYTWLNVTGASGSNTNGPNASVLRKYNTVIWETGAETTNTLTDSDRENITDYLTNSTTNPGLWLIGQGILNDTSVWSDSTFCQNILRVYSKSSAINTPNPLYGVLNDEISHGTKLLTSNLFGAGNDNAIPFTPVSDPYTTSIFYSNASDYWHPASSEYLGVKYINPSEGYRVVFFSWEFGFIDGGSSQTFVLDNNNYWESKPSSSIISTSSFSSSKVESSILMGKEDPVTLAVVSTIWSDNFETDKGWTHYGTNDEWERGQPEGKGGTAYGNSDPSSAHGGINVIGTDLNNTTNPNPGDYEINSDQIIVSPIFNCSGFKWVNLTFYRWLNVESNISDHAYIAINSSIGWQQIWENNASDLNDSVWQYQEFNISAYADDQDSVQIRFRLISDNNRNFSGWNIDDLYINGTVILPNITVDSPNGGETLIGGGSYLITWTATGKEPLTIDLYYSTDGGSTYPNTIATGLANTGSHSWAVPSINSDTVRVKAIATDSYSQEASDTSDANFTIKTTPTVTVTSPNGGENWVGGSQHPITWTATGVGVLTINLYYSTNSGSTYPNTIVTGLANTGSYTWTLPSINSNKVRVKVVATDASSQQGNDTSNADFTITTTSLIMSGENQRMELVYMVLHWLNCPDDRIELRVTPPDIYYGNQTQTEIPMYQIHPSLGNSYVLKAKIWNVGGTPTGVIIRFMDGDTVISSANVYVPASYKDAMGEVQNGNAIAEIVWTPLFAGTEQIMIKVDPDNVIGNETFRFNNMAAQNTTVYFFYDDLESGTDNWEHAGTVCYISGEKTLEDYPGVQNPNLNIPLDWQNSQPPSAKTPITTTWHTYDSCYYLQEASTSSDKYLTTPTIDLTGATSAQLTFWHKYDLQSAVNGAYVLISTTGGSKWRYITPEIPYTCNLYLYDLPEDDYGNTIIWCWNGVSAANTFNWEFATFDLTPYVGSTVKLRFYLQLYSGSTPEDGWYIDDVMVRVSGGGKDMWKYKSSDDSYGDNHDPQNESGHSWWLGKDSGSNAGYYEASLDNMLVSRPIDLTRAADVKLVFWTKFNINSASGWPPDGYRIEVTNDNGVTWRSMTLGVRASAGVSGGSLTFSDGSDGDGEETADSPPGSYWVISDTLGRVVADISGWRGYVIQIRFRMITDNTGSPFEQNIATVGFGGVYLDDIMIMGNTTAHGYYSYSDGNVNPSTPTVENTNDVKENLLKSEDMARENTGIEQPPSLLETTTVPPTSSKQFAQKKISTVTNDCQPSQNQRIMGMDTINTSDSVGVFSTQTPSYNMINLSPSIRMGRGGNSKP